MARSSAENPGILILIEATQKKHRENSQKESQAAGLVTLRIIPLIDPR